MKRWIYDIESYPNLFTVTLIDYDSPDTILKYEISEREDHRQEIISMFTGGNARFIGYNNKYYDNVVINYLLNNRLCSVYDLYIFSARIIGGAENDDTYRRYKYPKFRSLDLMLLSFSKKQRVSLKQLQVTMNWHNIMESPVPFDELVSIEDIDKVFEYNINDVQSTLQYAKACANDINLRLKIYRQYKLDALSKDPVQTGVDLMRKLYSQKTGIPEVVLRDMRTERPQIPLNECILDKIQFKSARFQEFLSMLKTITLSGTRGEIKLSCLYGGVKHDYGTGGIHSDDPAGIVVPKEDEVMIDADVTSLYPSLMIEYGFYPEHLGPSFLELYKDIRDQRVEAKKSGDKITNGTLKLALNGIYGNLIQPNSWVYDPKAAMSVTLNGQLFLSMLSEALTDAGMRVVSINTDGITALVKKTDAHVYEKVCKEWEQFSGLALEFNEYSKIIRKDVNDYIAVYSDGNVKLKGSFDYDVYYGKGFDKPIVPYALMRYYVNGIECEDTIKEASEDPSKIFGFCMSQKAARKFNMEWNGEKLQRTNRYYASKKGAYLYKVSGELGSRKSIHVLKGSPVAILNKYDEDVIKQYPVDIDYYIRCCKEVQHDIQSNQLELFV